MSKSKYFRSLGNFPGFSISTPYDFQNKENAISDYVLYMLSRTQSMFKYEGLPESIPQRMIELYLQCNGNCCITEYNGELYALTGGLGGEPDPYYRPTVYTVANPALNFSANLEIGKDCIVIPSDSMYMGLLPLFRRYATMLAENDLTIRIADINSRISSLVSAPDDNTKKAAEKYLKDVERGELGVIAENAFFDGIRSQPYSSAGHSNTITQLIEIQQYLKAGWYTELGLSANYNMKREALNSVESSKDNDALLPLVDDMLRCRQTALEDVNSKYGTNITVKLFSAWELEHATQHAEAQAAEETDMSAQAENPEEGGEENEDKDT